MDKIYEWYLASSGVFTDTRNVLKDGIFFALKGDRFNGNEYVQMALEQGAKYAVIDEENYEVKGRTFLVNNALETLQQLALHHRKTLKIPIIAITGSNGKTTSKELIHAVLSQKYKTAYTKGNLNNHIGVPLTLLSIHKEDEIAIVEMGANHQGEIASYCEYTYPDYGLITNVGKAHLEGFGGFEGVVKGKTEMYRFVASHGGSLFVNGDDSILMRESESMNRIIYGAHENSIANGQVSHFSTFLYVQFNDEWSIQSNLTGEYNLANILSAVAIGRKFNVDDHLIKKGIEGYMPTNSRSQVVEINTNTLILDAYNANPTSMDVALSNLEKIDGPKIAILGGMKELGVYSLEEHRKIALKAMSIHDVTIALVGSEFKSIALENNLLYFSDSIEAKKWYDQSRFKYCTILIKGSRATALEKILDKSPM